MIEDALARVRIAAIDLSFLAARGSRRLTFVVRGRGDDGRYFLVEALGFLLVFATVGHCSFLAGANDSVGDPHWVDRIV
ncbi:hypothetical protein NZK35_17705 [Stieleria sp. ICT_E10.1]|nr:hypothetical protein [Stieleria sedimenti]